MPRNARSAAVLQKLGFDKEGVARDYLKINGRWEDHILTALVLR
jgi:ribosomal-protein-alanine N-acetyltransferase